MKTNPDKSKKGWFDYTFNPWINRGLPYWDPDAVPGDEICERTMEANWARIRKRNKEASKRTSSTRLKYADNPDGSSKKIIKPANPRVLVGTRCDWLADETYQFGWDVDFFKLISQTFSLDWMLLTRTPDRLKGLLEAMSMYADPKKNEAVRFAREWLNGTPPRNVWIGVEVCSQHEADVLIPELIEAPAKRRFVICNPPKDKKIDLSCWLVEPEHCCPHCGAGILRGYGNDYEYEKQLLKTCSCGAVFGEWTKQISLVVHGPLITIRPCK